MYLPILVLLIFHFRVSHQQLSTAGTVQLDEYNFDKIVPKFEVVVVKFDVSQPYGQKHDVYTALARDMLHVHELLFGYVGVKESTRDVDNNIDLASKYKVNRMEFPVVKLFVRGKPEPFTYQGSLFTNNLLRRFIRNNCELNITLPGCLPSLDTVVEHFMTAATMDIKRKIYQNMTNVVKELSEDDHMAGNIYKNVMKTVLEFGKEFLIEESQRLIKLRKQKMSKQKKRELDTRLNVIEIFHMKGKPPREEL